MNIQQIIFEAQTKYLNNMKVLPGKIIKSVTEIPGYSIKINFTDNTEILIRLGGQELDGHFDSSPSKLRIEFRDTES